MSRLQKFLIVALVIELITLGMAWQLRSRMLLLPPIDWNAVLIDPTTASQIRLFERRFKPGNPASWEQLGAVYRAFGLFPQAEYCYRQLDKLSPGDRSYLYFWAESLNLMGRTAEATKLYRQIIDEKLTAPLGAQTAAYCWLNIGQDYLREENVPAAIEAFRQAPDIPKAKLLMSRVLIRSGRAKEAVVLLDQLLADYPAVIDYNQMKSWAEAELGNQDAAQDFYERSLRTKQWMEKMDPTFYARTIKIREVIGAQALQLKSLRLEAQGDLPGALAAIRAAIEACWTEDRASLEARQELRSGHPKEALALAQDCIQRAGASAPIQDIMGIAYSQLGDQENARHALEQAAEIEPKAQLYAELAVLSVDPQKRQEYQGLEQYMIGKETWLTNGLTTAGLTMALEHFEKAVALFDGYSHAWFYLAETRRFLGDAAGAEAAYRHCLQINPDSGRALRGLERLKRTTEKGS
jgi:tetratricopeptide (TPR) repeat protein